MIGGLPPDPPRTLQLIREVKVDTDPLTVAVEGEGIYVGTDQGKVLKVDINGEVRTIKSFNAGCYDFVVGICVFDQKVFCLDTNGTNMSLRRDNKIHVLELETGTLLQSWAHANIYNYYGSMTAISNGKIIVADVSNSRLTIYSLNGQLIRHVGCPQISSGCVCICVSPSNPDVIIVSDWESSQVFAVNLTTGAVLWTNSDISRPQGMVSYGSEHVLVTKLGFQTQLSILNVHTGQYKIRQTL